MTPIPPAKWGERPVRRWSLAELTDLGLPSPVREQLATAGLPEAVGPYFEVTDEPVRLADFAREYGLPEPPVETAAFWHLGSDNGSEICCDASGRVWSVFCEIRLPSRLVNTSVGAWLATLAEFVQLRDQLSSAPIGPEAVAAVDGFRARLTEIDPDAMTDPDHWWPLVADDLRLTASVDAGGVFEFRTDSGAIRQVTGYTVPGQGHVERRLWHELESNGIEPEQVTRVHTDLEPCMLPGGYCADWLAVTFPEAQVTYSFGYGPSPADRARGVSELIAFVEESDQ
ncbi:SUKH-4 family immunity protein [Kitasatospora sp. NPDC056138]|uniref:SUKH-4 family immunity protein n=1 Tax=Kitasatospora sp. NPDC056138 TaxID=3345724 RepID=UPI0035D85392